MKLYFNYLGKPKTKKKEEFFDFFFALLNILSSKREKYFWFLSPHLSNGFTARAKNREN